MILRVGALMLFAMPVAAVAQMAPNCPWFTTGSAAKLLGGGVSVEAHVNADRDGSCRFVRGNGATAQAIEIAIGKIDSHICPTGSTSLKTLGNQAMQCRRSMSGGQNADTIAGRMRDIYFVVTMIGVPDATRSPTSGLHTSDDFGASPLERAAEQVVGNLY